MESRVYRASISPQYAKWCIAFQLLQGPETSKHNISLLIFEKFHIEQLLSNRYPEWKMQSYLNEYVVQITTNVAIGLSFWYIVKKL